MKKTTLTILILLMLTLSACAGQSPAMGSSDFAQTATKGAEPVALRSATATPAAAKAVAPMTLHSTVATPTATAQDTSAAIELDTSYENAVSVELQLLLGTFELEGTNLAVTQEQAGVLLLLWNNFKQSRMPEPGQGAPGQGQDNASSQPPGAITQTQTSTLTQQILAAMTSEQITAIAEMKITQETAMTIMQEQGITMGGPQPDDGNSTQPPQGAPPAGGPQPPPGAPPGGSQQPPEGTPPAGGSQLPQGAPPAGAPGGNDGRVRTGSGMIPPEMIDALLQLLEERSGTLLATSSSSTRAGAVAPAGATSSTSAVYAQNGGTETKSGQAYMATETDQSGIYVTYGGTLNLADSTITTGGNTSSQDNSSLYGLNAAVLAADGGTINLANCTITTTGTGANGAFATGAGSSVSLSDVTINASNDGGHGVMATHGGSLTLTNVNMTTAGKNSGVMATCSFLRHIKNAL